MMGQASSSRSVGNLASSKESLQSDKQSRVDMTEEVSNPATGPSSSGSSANVSESAGGQKKSKWKRSLNDLVTVNRKNLRDFEEREREFYAKHGIARIEPSNNRMGKPAVPAKNTKLNVLKNRLDKGKAKLDQEDDSKVSNASSSTGAEDYIRQNYFPMLHSNSSHLASVNENAAETESFIFSNHDNNSSESSSILNHHYNHDNYKNHDNNLDNIHDNNHDKSHDDKDDDKDEERIANTILALLYNHRFEYEDDEDANKLLPNRQVLNFSERHREMLEKDIQPRDDIFEDAIYDIASHNGSGLVSPTISNHDKDKVTNDDVYNADRYDNIRLGIRKNSFDDNEFEFFNLSNDQQKKKSKTKSNSSVSSEEDGYEEHFEQDHDSSYPLVTDDETDRLNDNFNISNTLSGFTRSVSDGSVRNRRRTLNPFSRMNIPRLNLLSSVRSTNNGQPSPRNIRTVSQPLSDTNVTRNENIPTINLSSLAFRNSVSSTDLTPPLSSPQNEGGSSLIHQAQMLSRLLELAAHSTLHNLIGDYNGEDGVRIDNRNRNRDLSTRIPAHRFEDGSDANFSEFSVALQGNLLANELSNSIRLQLGRERRRLETENSSSNSNNNTTGTTAESNLNTPDSRSQSMSFFRAFRFSSRRPRNVSEDDDDQEEQVPVLIIGVRSVLPEEADRANMNGDNDVHMNNIVPGSNNEGHSIDSRSFTNFSNTNNPTYQNNHPEELAESSNSSQGETNHTEGQENGTTPPGPPPGLNNNSGGFARSFFRNRNHRSRFRLENSRNNSRLEEIAQSYGQRVRSRQNGTQRSWVIFIMGHTFPVDHPVLSAPTLLSDNPTYEDLLALQAMLGEVKPPVASQEDIDAAGGLVKIVVDDSTIRNSVIEPVIDNLPVSGKLTPQSDTESFSGDEVYHADKPEALAHVKVVSTDKCLVCLTEYEDDEICRRLKSCGHFFHQECIDQWLTTGRNSCPLCRKKGVAVKKKKVDSTGNINASSSDFSNNESVIGNNNYSNNNLINIHDTETTVSSSRLEIPLPSHGNETNNGTHNYNNNGTHNYNNNGYYDQF